MTEQVGVQFRKCVGTVFWSYLVMGHELGGATDIDRLLLSSGLLRIGV